MNIPLTQIYSGYIYSYPHKTAYRTLNNIPERLYYEKLTDSPAHLYFHIPFCESKCGYCNLFSISGAKAELLNDYVNALENQIGQLLSISPAVSWNSLTFGGGTPLYLDEHSLEKLFLLTENMNLDRYSTPINIETSPSQTSKGKLSLLKDFHVNRISIGVQSFVEDELAVLKRRHSPESAYKALDLILNQNFDCVNIDLIYGIPNQDINSLLYSLKKALSFDPHEIYIYPLYIRSGTDLHGSISNPLTYKMYFVLTEYLISHGYKQQSMRKFIRLDASSHTESNCGTDHTISLGCGGRSYIGNLHFSTPYSIEPKKCQNHIHEFIQQKNKLKITHGIFLNDDELKRRYLLKNLLHIQGLHIQEYEKEFQSHVVNDFPLILQLLEKKYCILKNNFLQLTHEGLSLSDYIGPLFISKNIRQLMKEW